MKQIVLLLISSSILAVSCTSKKGEIPVPVQLQACDTSTVIHTVPVQVLDNSFSPATITITTGDTVKWNWSGANPHTTTCDGTAGTTLPVGGTSWNSPVITGSGTYKVKVQVAGTYNYFCSVHGISMMGTIVVKQRCH